MNARDTIAAISTAAGRAGIGVVRVTGRSLSDMGQQITGQALPPRRAVHCAFHAADGSVLDDGLALYFPAPHSYTGEDVLELQGHGGPVVLKLLLDRCIEVGARIARPGEFTQRAFTNGKLDLAQAEGVIDLIDAATAHAARSAVRSMTGQFSSEVQALSEKLIELRMLVEATLDFPEEDVDFVSRAHVGERLEAVRTQLTVVLKAARQGSLLREGIHVVLAGEPNVGKSSLLNRLAGEELAIVTDVPGTTRDTIRQAISIRGVPVHVVDTAGLRDATDAVERIGVERAWTAIAKADVVLLVGDARVAAGASDSVAARLPAGVPRIRVLNKIDLAGLPPGVSRETGEVAVRVSALTGAGVDLLRDVLLELVGWDCNAEGVYLARQRHLVALRTAAKHLEAAIAREGLELLAEELRLAHLSLASITGEFTSDDLLGEIFSRFCIGK